jgi:NADPH2:quinone reductase
MRAAWYEKFGDASDVLVVGEMDTPSPSAGEVLVRVHATGINPSDVKLRSGARPGAVMAFPRIVPHSDGAGVIEAVGAGVDKSRIGERVWIWNASWQRAFGTAAEYVALPSAQAVQLPAATTFEEGACFGIPAMTAWYALFGDNKPIKDRRVLVTGGAGTVGRYACQMAMLGGAGDVLTTVSSVAKGRHSLAPVRIYYKESDVAEAVLKITGGEGIDRVVEVDFAANQADVLKIIKPGGVIASYASASEMVPQLDFYGFMFKDVSLRMLIVYQLDGAVRREGEVALNSWLEDGALEHAVVPGGGLDDIAAAHDLVASGDKLGTVVLTI